MRPLSKGPTLSVYAHACARTHGCFTSGLFCFVTFHRRSPTATSDLGQDGQGMVSVLSMANSEEVLCSHTREALFFLGATILLPHHQQLPAELQGERLAWFNFLVLSGCPVWVSWILLIQQVLFNQCPRAYFHKAVGKYHPHSQAV